MKRLLCDVTQVPLGSVVPVVRAGLPNLAVCNVGGSFYVIEDVCSHGESALSEGQLIGCEIECVLHKGRFNVTTGQATRRPAKKPVSIYRCVVEDGQLYLVEAAGPSGTSPWLPTDADSELTSRAS